MVVVNDSITLLVLAGLKPLDATVALTEALGQNCSAATGCK